MPNVPMIEQVFSVDTEGARRLQPSPARLERDVQGMFERNLESLMGLRFLASEFTTPCQTMRMDTICLDENLCPVIIEYKLDSDSSVINQGLYYLNWMISNRSVIYLMVHDVAGKAVADRMDWSGARVVIIAGAYSRYDLQAIDQMQANLDLYTYSLFEDGILVLKQVAGVRRPDYLATSSSRPRKTKLQFSAAHRLAPNVVQDRTDRFLASLSDLANDLTFSDQGEYRLISVPTSQAGELGRLHLTDSAYPKLRLEVFGTTEDLEFDEKLRTKKTRRGFEFSVTDDEYFDHAVEAIRKLYAAASSAW